MTPAKPPLGGSLAQRRGRRHPFVLGGWGDTESQLTRLYVTIILPCSTEGREKSRAQTITEARRPHRRADCEPRRRRGELQQSSNFFKNAHQFCKVSS